MGASIFTSRLGLSLGLCFFVAPRLWGAGPAAPAIRPVISPPHASPRAWEPDYRELSQAGVSAPGEDAFLQAARDFLTREGIHPSTVQVELAPLGDPARRAPGSWQALAEVFVDEEADGRMIKRLVFEPAFWLNASADRFSNHRWTKIMWHEIHHLTYFPINLRRGPEWAKMFPARSKDGAAWNRQWIAFLEPLEELAAERTCIERYQAAFGPLAPELLRDSRGDMVKYAALYKERLSGLLADARDPQTILQQFSPLLPVDSEGNIL